MARAGQFRDQVTFERLPNDTTDDYGNPADNWETVVTDWADIRETPGKETMASGRPEDTRAATLRVRSSMLARGITGSDRVVARGVTWDIRSGPIQIDRKGSVLEFIIETGVAV